MIHIHSSSEENTVKSYTRRLLPYVLLALRLFIYHRLPQPATYSYYSTHIIKWVTESNWPVHIVKDRELCELLISGRPTLKLPSATTVSRDLKTCFEASQQRVAKLLRVRTHPSHYDTYSTDSAPRNIMGTLTLRRTHGPHRTTAPSLPGPFTSNTTVKC